MNKLTSHLAAKIVFFTLLFSNNTNAQLKLNLHFESIDISLQGGVLVDPHPQLPYIGGEYGKIGVIFDKEEQYRGLEIEFFYLTPDNLQIINIPGQGIQSVEGSYRDHIGIELSGFWLYHLTTNERLKWLAGPIVSLLYELEDVIPSTSPVSAESYSNFYNSLGLKTSLLYQFSKGVGFLLSSKLMLLDFGLHTEYTVAPFFGEFVDHTLEAKLLREMYYLTAGIVINLKR